MLQELLEEGNHEGHNLKLTDEHLQTIFDAVSHTLLDVEDIWELATELGDSEHYDRKTGGAHAALMRMYVLVHAAPPSGKLVGSGKLGGMWWKTMPERFITFAEEQGVEDARENGKKAGIIIAHKQQEQHATAHAERESRTIARAKEKATKKFEDRWPTYRATITTAKVQKAVEKRKKEIISRVASGTDLRKVLNDMVADEGGELMSEHYRKVTFTDYLIEHY